MEIKRLNMAASRIMVIRQYLGMSRREFCSLINFPAESHLANVERSNQRVPQDLFNALCTSWPEHCTWFVTGEDLNGIENDFKTADGIQKLIETAKRNND